jgi:toxin ParE1/3/4
LPDKPSAAQRWLKKTMEQFSWLANNPACGEARDDIRPGLRSVSHGNYVIFFRSGSESLEIIRLLHGARDIERLI